MKKYPRQWKINLIEKDNLDWRELELQRMIGIKARDHRMGYLNVFDCD